MPTRRGLNFTERLSVDTVVGSADITGLVAGPCFVYGYAAVLRATDVTGNFTLSDSTSTADANKDPVLARGRIGAAAVSATTSPLRDSFNPPINVSNTGGLTLLATGVDVSVRYLSLS